MRASLRAGLALVLLVGFFVLVLALTVGLAGFAVYGFSTGRGGAPLKLAFAAAAVAIAVGAAVRAVLKVNSAPSGARLDRADQPELWQMLDELAKAAQTRGPDEVRIVAEVNAAVWEESRLLGLKAGKRYLEIGLPLLAAFNASELRAVLAHELGHYSHGHTRLGALTYRATMAMERTASGLSKGLLRWILGGYASLYALTARAANRAQEFQADAASVAVAGKAATHSALSKLPALGAAWSDYTQSYVGLASTARRTPELLLGFRAFLSNPKRQAELAEIERDALDNEPSSLFDSHPPIRKRLAAVAALPDSEVTEDRRPAWSLLRDPANTVPTLEADLLVKGLGPRASWPELVGIAGAVEATRSAAVLADAAVAGGVVKRGTLAELLDALQAGQGYRLVASTLDPELAEQDRAEAATELLTSLFADTIVAAMVAAGRARFEVNWGGPWLVRLSGGGELVAREFVGPAVSKPSTVPGLRQWLRSHGVPLDYLSPGAAGGSEETSVADIQVFGVLTGVELDQGAHDMLVSDSGLLLVPRQHGIQRPGPAELAGQSFEELFQRADTRWLAAVSIASGQLGRRPWGWSLDLRLTSGEALNMRSTPATEDHGKPYDCLHYLLGQPAAEPSLR